jgi:EAL domain-containing protein (putative c-di-GMP-specific phosphodiesterase class I)
VNLSARQINEPELVRRVSAALDSSGLAPDLLTLEITESVVMTDAAGAGTVLRRLKDLGVRLSIDDFGTGYSSLSHLRALPIDWLKIGKPFVDDGGLDRPFLRMILELAADLNLGVVAEGIESGGQLGTLRELGCGFGQGFYLGSPAELESAGHAPRLNDIADFRTSALAA